MVRGVGRVPGRQPVLDHGLRIELIGPLNRLERLGQCLVPAGPRLGVEAGEHRIAHVIVRRMEDHLVADLAQRREPLDRELRGLVVAADDAGSVRCDLDRQRPRCDARHRQHRLRIGR